MWSYVNKYITPNTKHSKILQNTKRYKSTWKVLYKISYKFLYRNWLLAKVQYTQKRICLCHIKLNVFCIFFQDLLSKIIMQSHIFNCRIGSNLSKYISIMYKFILTEVLLAKLGEPSSYSSRVPFHLHTPKYSRKKYYVSITLPWSYGLNTRTDWSL